jgi:hypothetical protein
MRSAKVCERCANARRNRAPLAAQPRNAGKLGSKGKVDQGGGGGTWESFRSTNNWPKLLFVRSFVRVSLAESAALAVRHVTGRLARPVEDSQSRLQIR